MAPKRADASGVPPDSSSIAGGTLGNTLVLTGLFIMRRTYCARTASRARAVALTIAMCCAFAWSNKRFAAFFSLTCSGVNPAGNAARHIGQVEKSRTRHSTRQHLWNTWLHAVVNSSRLGSATRSFSRRCSFSVSRRVCPFRVTMGPSPFPPSSFSSSPLARSSSFSSASPKKSHRETPFPPFRCSGEKHTAHISSPLPTFTPLPGVRGFFRKLEPPRCVGVEIGVVNTSRRDPWAGVRELVGSLFWVELTACGVACEPDGTDSGSSTPRELAATTVSPPGTLIAKSRRHFRDSCDE
mmetsp:Transcript_7068/g.23691  ORF Transcript_7068/g.23691 Transcript_7068/m.23691 type:complete len:297 (-) Transcript_7068:118-1008(-)